MPDYSPRWSRIVLEGAIIVASILLAFAIDAWWDGVQEERAERAALGSLVEEFEANLAELETVELRHRNMYEAGLAVLDIGYGRAVPDTAFQTQVSRALASEVWLDLETYALDSYLAAHADRPERIPVLRSRLAGYRSLVDQVWQQEAMARDLVRIEIMRVLADRYDILRVGTGSFAQELRARREDILRSEGSDATLLALVRDPVVRNLVTARLGREWIALVRTERLRAQYDSLMPLLRSGAGR